MVRKAKWVGTVDVWLFYEIVGKVNILEQKTRVKKMHLILEIVMLKEF